MVARGARVEEAGALVALKSTARPQCKQINLEPLVHEASLCFLCPQTKRSSNC